MNRKQLIESIVEKLLDSEILNLQDYNHDADALMKDAGAIIEESLKDYILIQGRVL